MNEQDRKLLNKIRDRLGAYGDEWPESMVIGCLRIIDSLDKQLRKVKEAGGPFTDLAEEAKQGTIEGVDIAFVDNDDLPQIWALIEGDYRRLAEVLEEIEDE